MNPEPPPGRSTAEWRRLDSRHYLHPFTDTKQLSAKGEIGRAHV